jgi:poly(A) polymerase
VLLEAAQTHPPDGLLRLAALSAGTSDVGPRLAASLKLSGAERARLIDALAADTRIAAGLPRKDARALLYRLGPRAFRDQLLLHWAARDVPEPQAWKALADLADAWERPRFPLDGRDAMAAGFDEGPALGALLHGLEEEWIAADFTLSREDLLARLKRKAERPGP